ncbi:hypothetical protein [Alicyclobacillus dauci]|uniref:Uncharacterized protein n=1 Tax=Alicyclobacillus dauci TaxID=1475485 RepID=A0ABY6Z5N9_9BACL|nr:hypothetical protein [Alicyclobacillus dauci]WAH38213.1 hypothetical protein NZD86_06945 [Alicyclobacillus dauci]
MTYLVHYGHIRRCMGQWVVCHTRQATISGRLLGCNNTHLFLQVPHYGMVAGDGNETPEPVHSVEHGSSDMSNASYYGGYGGYGRTAVALASVVGLTAIGLSAMWW